MVANAYRVFGFFFCAAILVLCASAPKSPAITLMTEDSAVLGDKGAGQALAEAGYNAADYMGAGMIRYHRGWQDGIVANGKSWPELTDAWVADVRRRGFTPYLTITLQPGTYSSTPSVADFGNRCQWIATRYASTVSHYAVWNEPNSGGGEEPTPGGLPLRQNPVYFNQLYRECYNRIKAVSAGFKVYYGEIDAHVEHAIDELNDALRDVDDLNDDRQMLGDCPLPAWL